MPHLSDAECPAAYTPLVPPAAPASVPPPWRLARGAGAGVLAIAIVGLSDTAAALLHFSTPLAATAIEALVIFAVAWLLFGNALKAPARAAAVGCVSSLLVLGVLGLGVRMALEGGTGLVAGAVLALSLGLAAASTAFVRWLRGVALSPTSAAEDVTDRIRVALSAMLSVLGIPWLLARSSSENLGAVAPAVVVAAGMTIALTAFARSFGRSGKRLPVGTRIVLALCLTGGAGVLAIWIPRWREAYANRFRGYQERPTPVAGLEGTPRELAVANGAVCAVLEDGRVACWGENLGRFLGKADRPHDARELAGLRDVERLELGPTSACATFRSRPETWCWKGDDSARHAPGTPMTVQDLPKVSHLVIAGSVGYAAAAADGSLYRFGLDAKVPSAQPLPLAGIQAMAARRHVCAVDHAGAVFCWGESDHGQCGVVAKEVDTPRRVELPKPATRIAVGGFSTWAVLEDGAVFWWGSARIVTGEWTTQPAPRPFPLPEAPRALAVGAQFACALTFAKRVLCWGQADAGVFNNGEPGAEYRRPELVLRAEGIDELVADDDGVCARVASGRVSCWGRL
jgi:hypothetical protein